MKTLSRLFGIVLLVAWAAPGSAQATATVPPLDPVYRAIDNLAAAGLIDTMTVGQRPYSRREIAHLLGQARRNLPRLAGKDTWARQTLDAYAADYPAVTPSGSTPHDRTRDLFNTLSAEFDEVNSPPRGIPPDGNGAIDVALNPLTAYNEGRDVANGTTFAIETDHRLDLFSWLVLDAHPRISILETRGSGSTSLDGQAEQLYARAVFGDLAITVGRDYNELAQGVDAGLLGSLDAPAYDLIRLSTDHPLDFPILSRLFGPLTGTLFDADLGPSQNFPHAKLIEYKLSAQPLHDIELGGEVLAQVGGDGAPAATFWRRVEWAIPPIGGLFPSPGKRIMGLDARWRIPSADGLELYGEGAVDDFDYRRLQSIFTQDAAYIWGASVSCVLQCGTLRITGEYHTTGLRFYTDYPVTSGETYDHQLIGDDLGPRGQGAYLWTELNGSTNSLTFEDAWELRSGDQYESIWTQNPKNVADSSFHFAQTAYFPAESRWRQTVEWTRGAPNARISTRIELGLERVKDFAFQAGTWRTNALATAGIEIRP